MKTLFNYLSLAKPLSKDVLTSPWRVHNAIRSLRKAPGDHLEWALQHVMAGAYQAGFMVTSASIAIIAADYATGRQGTFEYAAAFVGLALGPALITKALVESFEAAAKVFGPHKENRPLPVFEAFPEFNKARMQMRPQ